MLFNPEFWTAIKIGLFCLCVAVVLVLGIVAFAFYAVSQALR